MSRLLRSLLALALLLALVASACGSDNDLSDESTSTEDDGGDAAADAGTEDAGAEDASADAADAANADGTAEDGTTDPVATPDYEAILDGRTKPEVELPDEAPDELVIEDLVEGDGEEAVVGANVTVHYVGVSYSTGEQFDASWDGGQPIQFSLVEGGLIDGWVQGLPGMKVGGRRQLVIPPELGYGSAGTGSIGPDETLVFVIDLLEVELPEFPFTSAADEPEFTIPDPLPEEVEVVDLVEGEGQALAEGDTFVLHFVVVDPETGEQSSSWAQGQPIELTLGTGQVGNEALEDALLGMKVGGRRQVVLPADPEAPEGDPAATTFYFLMDLVAIR